MSSFLGILILYLHLFYYKAMFIIHPPESTYQIILKADDLKDYSSNVKKIDEIIEKENIKISWGIIGKSLENPDQEYIKFLKDKSDDKHYHFFNHGYTHICSIPNKHIENTQNIVKNKVGITLNAIGVPCNHFNDDTIRVIDKIPEIKYWYFGANDAKNTIRRSINLENGVGNPDFKFFKNTYDKQIKKGELLTLQIHPYMWNKIQFLNFKTTVNFLKSQGYEFITPEEIKENNK